MFFYCSKLTNNLITKNFFPIMSTNIEETTMAITKPNPIVETFKLAWTAGRILFTQKNDSNILRDAFRVASEICKSENQLVQMTLNCYKILLDNIIERNDNKATDNIDSLGNDIVELIKCLHQ